MVIVMMFKSDIYQMCISFVPLLLPALQHCIFSHPLIPTVFRKDPSRVPTWSPFDEGQCCASDVGEQHVVQIHPGIGRRQWAFVAATRSGGHNRSASLDTTDQLPSQLVCWYYGSHPSLSPKQHDIDKVFSSCCWMDYIQCLLSLQQW